MQSGFTKKAEEVLQNAARAAAELGHGSIGSEHILMGLLRTKECQAGSILISSGVEESKLLELIRQVINNSLNVGVEEPD